MKQPTLEKSGLIMEDLGYNLHLNKIRDHFGGVDFQNAVLADRLKFVFICFTNRSGSNYLAELLSSSGRLNVAEEDLNFRRVIGISTKWQIKSFQAYFSHLTKTRQRNDFFCLKTSMSHLELLRAAGILDQIIDRVKFVLIERADKLGQAISFAIAFETNKYTSFDTGSKDESELDFSKEKITDIMKKIVRANAELDMFFALNSITPVHISYELLTKDPVHCMTFVAEHIGLPDLEVVVPNVRIHQQRSHINDAWRAAYLASP